jgi:hypothetical protein
VNEAELRDNSAAGKAVGGNYALDGESVLVGTPGMQMSLFGVAYEAPIGRMKAERFGKLTPKEAQRVSRLNRNNSPAGGALRDFRQLRGAPRAQFKKFVEALRQDPLHGVEEEIAAFDLYIALYDERIRELEQEFYTYEVQGAANTETLMRIHNGIEYMKSERRKHSEFKIKAQFELAKAKLVLKEQGLIGGGAVEIRLAGELAEYGE